MRPRSGPAPTRFRAVSVGCRRPIDTSTHRLRRARCGGSMHGGRPSGHAVCRDHERGEPSLARARAVAGIAAQAAHPADEQCAQPAGRIRHHRGARAARLCSTERAGCGRRRTNSGDPAPGAAPAAATDRPAAHRRRRDRGQDHGHRQGRSDDAAARHHPRRRRPHRPRHRHRHAPIAPPRGSAASSPAVRSRSRCWRRPPRPPASPGPCSPPVRATASR